MTKCRRVARVARSCSMHTAPDGRSFAGCADRTMESHGHRHRTRDGVDPISNMQNVFAYVRVSTTRQGQEGVSLPEQRRAIEQFAQRKQLRITQWFDERESAAKRGRPVFNRMLAALSGGQA